MAAVKPDNVGEKWPKVAMHDMFASEYFLAFLENVEAVGREIKALNETYEKEIIFILEDIASIVSTVVDQK